MSTIPPANAAAHPRSPHAHQPAAVGPGVLVVDDEKLLRAVLRSGLERYGFRVWVAADAAEAVAVYRANGSEIAVVLLDVCMPGTDGPGTLDELRSLNRELVACFMSGHTGAYGTEELLRRGVRCVFAKPFDMERLAAALRSVVPATAPLAPA